MSFRWSVGTVNPFILSSLFIRLSVRPSSYVRPCVRPSVCTSGRPSVCPSVCPYARVSIFILTPVYPSVHRSAPHLHVRPYVMASKRLLVFTSVTYVCLNSHLSVTSVCLYVSPLSGPFMRPSNVCLYVRIHVRLDFLRPSVTYVYYSVSLFVGVVCPYLRTSVSICLSFRQGTLYYTRFKMCFQSSPIWVSSSALVVRGKFTISNTKISMKKIEITLRGSFHLIVKSQETCTKQHLNRLYFYGIFVKEKFNWF